MGDASKTKPVIGIVGGIGAGKSTAASAFAELGCVRIDADAVGHELLGRPEVRRLLRDRWGRDIFAADGAVDRAALGRIVFADAAELAALDRIMHPRMRAELEQRIGWAARRADVPAIVLDAAVLFEAAWDDLCSAVVFVRAPRAQRARRVRQDRGWVSRTLREREKLQFSLDSKARKCDYTIENNRSIPHVHAEVREIFDRILHGTDQPK